MSASEKYSQARGDLRFRSGAAFGALLLILVLSGPSLGQELNRKVIARAAPGFPELAKRMHLTGRVKLELVITPAGSVKSASLVGGNPVFEQSALETVKPWRFEAREKETKASILLEFAEQ
ncbi:MAG: energy transducer TonB [Terriglobales bacterium]|jgi:TonB family protein